MKDTNTNMADILTNETKKDEEIQNVSWTQVVDDGQKPANRATVNNIFAQNDTPTSTDKYVEGDLWFDTDNNNEIYRANSSLQWVSVKDGSIATAQSTADGKAKIFTQANPPTSVSIGDLWIDTDNNQ